MHTHNAELSVFSIGIELNVLSATSAVRFPSLFSVQWKTNDQKVNLQTSKHSPEAGKTQFNENLLMKTQMVHDKSKHSFAKKQTLVQLNLVSKNRPDQPKLVGRITIDLANILNKGLYSLPTEFALQFCSVNASLLLSFKVVEKIQTDISVSQIEKSCGDVIQLNTSNRISGISATKDKSRDLSQFSHDFTPLSNKHAETVSSNQRQSLQMIQTSSNRQTPISVKEPIPQKDNASIKDVKQPIFQQKNNNQIRPINQNVQYKSLPKQKQEIILPHKQNEILTEIKLTPSSKELHPINSSKIIGPSAQNEQSRASENKMSQEVSRQKSQIQKLKLQIEKKHHEQQKYRFQIERQKKEMELLRLQSRQKQGSLDKATHQANSLKGQIARLRDQAVTIKQQTSSVSLKLSQVRDINNKLAIQLNSAQKEIKELTGVQRQLTGVQKLVQESQGAKSELNSRLQQFARQLEEYQSKCFHLQKEKYDLEGTLLRFSQDGQVKEHSYSLQIETLQAENNLLTQQINRQQIIKSEQFSQIDILQQQNAKFKQEIENLQSKVSQYSKQKQAWLIEQNVLDTESKQKSERIKQIEETLIILEEKGRQLEKQILVLTQNCQQKSQQIQQIIGQKALQASKLSQQIKRWEEETKRYKSLLDQQTLAKQNIQSKNVMLQQQLIALNERFNTLGAQYEHLVSQHQNITHQHNNQVEVNKNLQSAHAELNQKYNLLEQLLISTNEQKMRENDEASIRQQNLNQKIMELTDEVSQVKHYAQVGYERMNIFEKQLSDRQHMIGRLQESLTHQIERNEELNNQLGSYYQREERFKLTITVLETQFKRIEQLLVEQQIKDSLNVQLLKQHQTKISELNVLISSKTQSYQSLEAVIDQSDKNTANEIASLNSLINQKNNKITWFQNHTAEKDQMTKRLQQKNAQMVLIYQEKIIQQQQLIENLRNQITTLENTKNTYGLVILECESKIARLQSDLFSKQSELNAQIKMSQGKLAQLQQICHQYKQSEEYNKLIVTEIQSKYDELTIKYTDLQNQLSLKEELSKQDANKYNNQISELKQSYQILQNDKLLFDIVSHKQQLKVKINQVTRLEGQLHLAKIQNAKIQNLERALKIKSIQLNSLKFRSKGDTTQNKSQVSELIKLKDEQISSLSTQKNRLLTLESQFIALKQKMSSLTQELELLQEEKFNIESKGNEIALTLEETKEQNRRLIEEIAIMRQRNGQLQRTIQEMYPKQGAPEPKGQKSLIAENLMLKKQIKQIDVLKNKILSLEEDRKMLQNEKGAQELQKTISLINQSGQNTKSKQIISQTTLKKDVPALNEDPKNIVLLNNTYKSLKELITTRIKGKTQEKLVQLLDTFLNNQTKKSLSLQEKSKLLSKQFQKLKIYALKRRQNKEEERTQLMVLFKNCENIITQFLAIS